MASATINWPLGLPGKSASVKKDSIADTRIHTTTDTGVGKTRARFSASPRTIVVELILNGAERVMFDHFWDVTTQGGALPFLWEDPVDDAAIDVVFGQRPDWAQFVGGSPAERVWIGDLELRVKVGAT